MSFKQVCGTQLSLSLLFCLSRKHYAKTMTQQEIEVWVKAVGQYDNHEFEESLKTFEEIADTAKILFNCGVIHATLGQHHKAVRRISSIHQSPWG